MMLFLIIFLLGYGSMNSYVVWKIGRGLGVGRWGWLLLAVAALLLILAPIAAHQLVENHPFAARIVALAGYYWMTVVMWVLFFGVLTDLWNIGVRVGASYRPGIGGLGLTPSQSLRLYLCLVGVLTAWGLWEGSWLLTREVRIGSPKVPAGSPPLVIAQISDVHVGVTQGKRVFERIMQRIREIDPDILVCTGDFLDAESPHSEAYRDLLAALSPRLGKFAVIGNHEYYAGIDNSLSILEGGGFQVLREESVPVNEWLTIAGVDDPAGLRRGTGETGMDDANALAGIDSERFVIFLKHRPVVNDEVIDRFDLQLSGHTHGGQIFPFGLAVSFFYKLGHGYIPVGWDTHVYVSRGTGNWGPPLRVFAPREIAVFTLEHQAAL